VSSVIFLVSNVLDPVTQIALAAKGINI